jgi:hypothetical protein
MRDQWVITLCVAMVLCFAAWAWHANAECNERGGQWARTLWTWGYKCMRVEELD